MKLTIALAGNPNCGKTTMFNDLTGSAQYVGNWPGVTVEKKEGKLKGHKDVVIQDLPGIYSLSPYTLEEVVTRSYLVKERPNAIINIIDGTNIERNLYLTTQLLELGIPMIIAINMIDVVRKRGDVINLKKLSEHLGCEVIETSALKGIGSKEVAEKAVKIAEQYKTSHIIPSLPQVFKSTVRERIMNIESILEGNQNGLLVCEENIPWIAIKLFERDEKILKELKLPKHVIDEIENNIKACEDEMDDDAESIITNERYTYIGSIIEECVQKKHGHHKLSASDKIDRIVTNRWAALPLFVGVMFLVYYISVTTVGAFVTDWTNETLFGEWIIPGVKGWMEGAGVTPWLVGLVSEGIIGGVGAVLGFVPQMLILFVMLSCLEDCGYMARVAFIMDRIFRKFGLSGKSFIPMLIGSGCSVPGIMASRTIEHERDRRMTIMTTSFIPCGAKMPIIALIAGALFGGAWWVAPAAYFIGVAAVIISGIILKKTKAFAGKPAPFVMELPAYHIPTVGNVWRATWERGWSFIKRAGTVILLSSIALWFLQGFGIVDGSIAMVEDNNTSLLSSIGRFIAPIFAPLGFGTWQASVGTFTGLIAKENVVNTFGVLYGFAEVAEDGMEYWTMMAKDFTALQAFSFMVFNLLCAPCFAAMGAIKREMNSGKWTWFAIAYLCIFAYIISFMVYQIGLLFTGAGFTLLTALGFAMLGLLLYLMFRKNKYENVE
ncbi:ferrous iron transport protein B [Hathewaya proteolytica DSM 3090]|uniref:Ferrous iron transport protein B n=1 Tax=Hathewaya proteolytica DSM 3090 TaxID=1121331 RepID=A0A1M6PRZ0_9CLOT|nr:ferrous iron transport protein B [Hathewaya proteolytica]SHK10695.1 ferrous iron transport protein B [Hathewaya proteolytica DSM 3090]